MPSKMLIEQEPNNMTPIKPDLIKFAKKTGVLEVDNETLRQYLPEYLQNQLHDTVELYKNYNEKLPKHLQRSERDFAFIEHFYASFLLDRNRRAADIEQERYQKIVEKALDLLPTRTFFVLCMDGRVKIIHTNGMSADIASAIRTPGGMLDEFIRIDGELTLGANSTYAKMLIGSSQKGTRVTQILDSHYTCAARKGEEAATGHYPTDSGLFRDVLHKKEMAEAAKKFLKDYDGENVTFVQTTFNPITGYMYMGLETEEAQRFTQEKAKSKAIKLGNDPERAGKHAEYSKDVLKELIQSGKIISTGHLISDEKIKEAFDSEYFAIDRVHEYVDSAEKFLDKIQKLWNQCLPTLREKILGVYPELATGAENDEKEIDERVMLLLTNSFNTYLINRNHNEIEYLEMEDHDYEQKNAYIYGIHNEAGVKVSEGGHPLIKYQCL